jgi:hypothetical protein
MEEKLNLVIHYTNLDTKKGRVTLQLPKKLSSPSTAILTKNMKLFFFAKRCDDIKTRSLQIDPEENENYNIAQLDPDAVDEEQNMPLRRGGLTGRFQKIASPAL